MTVSYSLDVSTSRVWTFGRLLFRWRASIYKIIWRELLLFLILFYALNLSHRYLMSPEQKNTFEQVCIYCGQYIERVPLTFVLAFYIGIIFQRWWDQFQCIAWPDRLAMYLGVYIRDLEPCDQKARMIRRTIIRHLNLAAVLGLRMVSSAVKKRFPTLAHLVESGLMDEEELKMYQGVNTRDTKEYVPLQWALSNLYRCNTDGHLTNERAMLELLKEVNDFRHILRRMIFYDWISMPLVYTQVVTIAVYSFFLATVFGAQQFSTPASPKFPAASIGTNLTKPDAFQQNSLFEFDLYFPIFTVLEVFLYVGWLKVAEVLINPFGGDDDDFEVNYIVERNLEVSYIMVDDNYDVAPTLKPDKHWTHKRFDLFHTAASYGLQDHRFLGSTAGIGAPEEAEIAHSFTVARSPSMQKTLKDGTMNHHQRVNASISKRRLSTGSIRSIKNSRIRRLSSKGENAAKSPKISTQKLSVLSGKGEEGLEEEKRGSEESVFHNGVGNCGGGGGGGDGEGDSGGRQAGVERHHSFWKIFGINRRRNSLPPATRLYDVQNPTYNEESGHHYLSSLSPQKQSSTQTINVLEHSLDTILEVPTVHKENSPRPNLREIFESPKHEDQQANDKEKFSRF